MSEFPTVSDKSGLPSGLKKFRDRVLHKTAVFAVVALILWWSFAGAAGAMVVGGFVLGVAAGIARFLLHVSGSAEWLRQVEAGAAGGPHAARESLLRTGVALAALFIVGLAGGGTVGIIACGTGLFAPIAASVVTGLENGGDSAPEKIE